MNKSLLIGLIAGAGATLGVGALANFMLERDRAAPPAIAATGQAASPTTGDERLALASEVPALATEAAAEEAFAPAPVAVAPAAPPVPRIVQAVRREPEYARVVHVQPVSRTVSEPREVCRDVEVVQQAPVRDQHQIAGTVIGGAIGGVIGNQIGGGDGRQIAKVVGAIGGAYAGNKVQERIQHSRKVTTIEKQCETVYEPREVPDGYSVTYEWNGGTHTARMPSDPGPRLPVREGEVVLVANAG